MASIIGRCYTPVNARNSDRLTGAKQLFFNRKTLRALRFASVSSVVRFVFLYLKQKVRVTTERTENCHRENTKS